jgi:alpha-glucosidase
VKQLHKDSKWWKEGVIYQIYPRSFFDADGDGVGDIKGIIAKLDYLKELGVAGVWISPINESPMFDFGYDISDYRRIDPVFGSMEDFDKLIAEAHKRNIGIIMDLVLNHSSHLHPWFKDNEYRDFYIWKDPSPGASVPNNWKAVFGGSAWTFDSETGQYYLHSFLPQQPDLNWRNPECRKAIFEEIRFWLDRGVDGFRLDVINLIGKDGSFRNQPFRFGWPPRPYELQKHIYDRNSPETHLYLKELRSLLDEYPGTFSVGEILLDTPVDQPLAASFTGKGDQLHLIFDFSLTFNTWLASSFASILKGQYDAAGQYGGHAAFVLSNHDVERAVSRYGAARNRDALSRLLGLILLTQSGTPFLYMGEEIGMENGKVPRSRIMDPVGKRYWPFHQGRDGERMPMQWNSSPSAGFSINPEASPWLPVHSDYRKVNVEHQESRNDSVLAQYRHLIALRKKCSALCQGTFELADAGDSHILSYTLRSLTSSDLETFLVLGNFRSRGSAALLPEGKWQSIFSTREAPFDQDEGGVTVNGKLHLRPLEGLILKRIQARASR